jgi:hypothetical protein
MNEPNKKETLTQWLVNNIVLYAIPFCITLGIVVTESWPYKPLRQFIHGNRSGKFGDSAKDIIMTGIFLINAFVIWVLKYVFTKFKKMTN